MTAPRGTVRMADLSEAERRLTLALLGQKSARELAERSCQEQGIPLKITNPVALGRIADLLLSSPEFRK